MRCIAMVVGGFLALIAPLVVLGSGKFPGGPGDPDCPDDFQSEAAIKVILLDGTQILVAGLFDDHTIVGRSDPFIEGGDGPKDICDGGSPVYPNTLSTVSDSCRPPIGWVETPDERRELHAEILSLQLVDKVTGITIRAGQPYFDSVNPGGLGVPAARYFLNSTGEVASQHDGDPEDLMADLPANSYFNVFVEVEIPAIERKVYNKTPMVLKTELETLPPNLALPPVKYIHDAEFGTIHLFDEEGLPFGYLISAAHGAFVEEDFVDLEDAQLGVLSPADFTVDQDTFGLDPFLTTMTPPNHVFDDADPPVEEKMVTVYESSGQGPGSVPDKSNARIDELVGSGFDAQDSINSLSYGKDGMDYAGICTPDEGTVFFSVSRSSIGKPCTDVWYYSQQLVPEQAAAVYAAFAPPFGRYTDSGAVQPLNGDNVLAADATELGLRPVLADSDQDNITSLELSLRDNGPQGDFVYLTLTGPSYVADGATIYVLNVNVDPFEPATLSVFATASDMGLSDNDVIDALVLSDVTGPGCPPQRNGTLDPDEDEVLFSLAPGSPSGSPADIFYSDFDGTSPPWVFLSASELGLESSDDIDALDVKPVDSGAQQGGCCLMSTGACLNTTASGCEAMEGTYLGDGLACQGDLNGNGANDACEPPAVCGNGIVEAGEFCDDGNPDDGDGCSSTCTIENGWDCDSEPSVCAAICGDGVIAGLEVCDDGNADPDDGCSSACSVEGGWNCTGQPSACTTLCGDGTCAGGENFDNCPQDCGIPALSERGVVVMVVLVLAVGTLVLRRRGSAA